jgi:pyridoxine 4-dehydrogenase
MSTQLCRLAGRPVHRIGFGAMQLPGPGVFGPPRDRSEALRVLRRAVELGVDHIDTSQYYGPDVANEMIREALHPYPEDLVLVSKVGAAREADGGWIPAQRPEQLRRGVEENLRSLAVERVDVVNLRLMGEEEVLERGPGVPLEEQLAMMVELREEGKIGGIGLSNVTVGQVRTALAHTDIACIQNQMSLLHQADEMLRLCHDESIPFVPFFPLGSAFPGIPKVTEQPAVRNVASRLGATPAQIGLAWLLTRSPYVLLIPGTSSLAHLEENQAVGSLELDAEALEELEDLRA